MLGFFLQRLCRPGPGSADDIAAFCSPILASSSDVRQARHQQRTRHPLYARLIAAQPSATFPAGSDFVENLGQYNCLPKQAGDDAVEFREFLVGRDGTVLQRFSPDTAPDDAALLAAIEAALAQAR